MLYRSSIFSYQYILLYSVLVTTQPEIDKLLIDEFFVWGKCQPTNQRPAVTTGTPRVQLLVYNLNKEFW